MLAAAVTCRWVCTATINFTVSGERDLRRAMAEAKDEMYKRKKEQVGHLLTALATVLSLCCSALPSLSTWTLSFQARQAVAQRLKAKEKRKRSESEDAEANADGRIKLQNPIFEGEE